MPVALLLSAVSDSTVAEPLRILQPGAAAGNRDVVDHGHRRVGAAANLNANPAAGQEAQGLDLDRRASAGDPDCRITEIVAGDDGIAI